MEIDPTLRAVLESVLGPTARIRSFDDGPATISEWDSAKHLEVILAIEEEFDVHFETAEIMDLVTVSKIQERLSDRKTLGR